jgi:tRNA G10  N-methylase Trm11
MDKNLSTQTLLILGRNPVISIAEIRSVFPQAKICAREKEFAIFEGIEEIDLKKIGGVIKTGQVFAREMNYSQLNLKEKDAQQIYEFIAEEFSMVQMPRSAGTPEPAREGKQTFGISIYPFDSRSLKTLLIGAKKFLKAKGISARFANKDFTNLTNPQSEFEIIKKGGIEIIAVWGGRNWFFAKLTQNQPFDSYRKRDYEKAFRDARVGMLPPKLAQVMVNLGAGDGKDLTVYDPFCGVGGVLTEAALIGHKVVGSDLDERMVEFSQKNLTAMKLEGDVFIHDAKQKLNESDYRKYDVIVSEGYLGPPRKTIPEPVVRHKIFEELKELYQAFFTWVDCPRVVICFPIYLEGGKPKYFASTEILPVIQELGWKMKNTEKLIYSRENQTVGREVVVLEKS